MSNWVKLHPEKFAEQLSAFRGCKSPEKSIGEWACGLSAGIAGAMLRIGASQAESDGHAYGASLLKASKEDKEIVKTKKSEAGKLGNAARWGNRKVIAEASQRDTSATENGIAEVSPREERRGEEKRGDLSPRGDKGDPLPPMPVWKEAKIQALRRQIEDHRTKADRWEKLNPRPETRSRELSEKIEAARQAVRDLETEILSNGVPL